MICPKCGIENNADMKFCSNCGAQINVETENKAAATAAQTSTDRTAPQQPVVIYNTATPAKAPSSGLSVAALVCGLLGIIGSFVPVVKYFTLVLAILGIVFGVIGKKKAAEAGSTNTGLATAGLVLGIIGTAFSLVGVICALACVGATGAAADTVINQVL